LVEPRIVDGELKENQIAVTAQRIAAFRHENRFNSSALATLEKAISEFQLSVPDSVASKLTDVKDNVLPYSYKKEWWEWERAKDEIKNMGSGAAPLSFVDENEAVNHILQVVRRDEIAIGITYNQSKEIDSHKDDRPTKRRRKEDSQGNAPA